MKDKYPDDMTMEDDDSDRELNGQDDGLPMLCRCGNLFEAHEACTSIVTGKAICNDCKKGEEKAEKIKELAASELVEVQKKRDSLAAQLRIAEGRIKTLKKQLV